MSFYIHPLPVFVNKSLREKSEISPPPLPPQCNAMLNCVVFCFRNITIILCWSFLAGRLVPSPYRLSDRNRCSLNLPDHHVARYA